MNKVWKEDITVPQKSKLLVLKRWRKVVKLYWPPQIFDDSVGDDKFKEYYNSEKCNGQSLIGRHYCAKEKLNAGAEIVESF